MKVNNLMLLVDFDFYGLQIMIHRIDLGTGECLPPKKIKMAETMDYLAYEVYRYILEERPCKLIFDTFAHGRVFSELVKKNIYRNYYMKITSNGDMFYNEEPERYSYEQESY